MRSAKRNTLALLILIGFNFTALISSANVETVLGGVALKNNANLAGIIPSSKSSEVIISRDQYVISYNKERRAPNWVAWKVEEKQLGTSGRTNKFSQDPDLEAYLSQLPGDQHAVDSVEYQGSCFDRGHQIPSADRTDTPENNRETFVMSNMIPQTPYLNRVIWEHLESYTRDLVHQGKKVYVIAGPIYDQDFGAIGPKKDIPIPSKDFKIIVVLDADQTPKDITHSTPVISVVMPNSLEDGSDPTDHDKLCSFAAPQGTLSTTDWQQYKASVADIEKLSGLTIRGL